METQGTPQNLSHSGIVGWIEPQAENPVTEDERKFRERIDADDKDEYLDWRITHCPQPEYESDST